nr:uncharacterized protein LOC129163713 [Nothobranchius furzeri]
MGARGKDVTCTCTNLASITGYLSHHQILTQYVTFHKNQSVKQRFENKCHFLPSVPQVRHICDVSSWYTMLTEVLCCGPCTKAARAGDGGTVGRWLAWDPAILSQLSEAHQAGFPAVLTAKMVQNLMKRCFSLDSQNRKRPTRFITAMQRMEPWMLTCPTSLSPTMRRRLCTTQLLTTSAVQTPSLASSSWKGSALFLCTLG